jgi:hypothetical protein
LHRTIDCDALLAPLLSFPKKGCTHDNCSPVIVVPKLALPRAGDSGCASISHFEK